MTIQITIGSVLIVASIVVALVSFWILQAGLARARDWLAREPHRPKMLLVVCATVLWILGTVTAGVWMWAVLLQVIGVFDTLEAAVYFALVAFTTLGFGDILLPMEWRLLGGMAASNGLLLMGLLTAMLVEVLRDLRVAQEDWIRRRESS